MRRVTGAVIAVASACALTVLASACAPATGHSARPVTKKDTRATKPKKATRATLTDRTAGTPPVAAAPFYVSLDARSGAATVHRTATGTKIATVRPPRGEVFEGVAAAGDDRTFVLATGTSHFYRLRLNGKGRPGKLALTAVPSLPGRFGSCLVELAGVAVSPDGRLLAASVLSNCPNGRAGPSEILTFQLGSGRTLAKFHPGHGYPMPLSWTAKGSLAYGWTDDPTDVFIIPDATKPGSSPRLLVKGTASVDGFDSPSWPLITPDGSAVLVTVGRGSFTFAIARFAVRSHTLRLLTPPVRNPLAFCSALWTDASGRGLLTGCGDTSEYEIQNRQLTKLRDPWVLPTYPVPSPPAIAW